MRALPFAAPSSRAWRFFALLIAAPALGLSWLGLQAVTHQDLEREQLARRQQVQFTAVADAAIANVLNDLESRLRETAAAERDSREPARSFEPLTPITVGDDGVIVFPVDRVYFGDFGRDPAVRRAATVWAPEVARLIEDAQTSEVQRRTADAVRALEHVSRIEPRLKVWAGLVAARVRYAADARQGLDAVADPAWAESAGLTPSGLPVALVASALAESAPVARRSRFEPLLRRTLHRLRDGVWWLSVDERRFHDGAIRALLARGGTPLRADDRLERLTAIAALARRSPPYRRDRATRAFERSGNEPFLPLWVPVDAAGAWIGVMIPRPALTHMLDASLVPLVSEQPFAAAVRDADGVPIWSSASDRADLGWHVQPLRAVDTWDLAFSPPISDSAWSDPRLLWYGFITMLVLVLMYGLWATAERVRHELEFARLRSEFVGAVTHEFKSPITSIRLLLERLRGGRLGPEEDRHAYQEAIACETDRLDRLVTRLLATQQIEAGRRQYEFAAASIRDLVADAVAHLQPHADAAQIDLRSSIDVDVPEQARLDATALGEALENLIDNALKYSPAATTVMVRAEMHQGDLRLSVTDQGIGFDAEETPKLFERFYRARRGNRLNVRGTGLGLAVVKAAAEAHRGNVLVTSAPGQGATFTIVLPIEG